MTDYKTTIAKPQSKRTADEKKAITELLNKVRESRGGGGNLNEGSVYTLVDVNPEKTFNKTGKYCELSFTDQNGVSATCSISLFGRIIKSFDNSTWVEYQNGSDNGLTDGVAVLEQMLNGKKLKITAKERVANDMQYVTNPETKRQEQVPVDPSRYGMTKVNTYQYELV